MNTAPKPWWPGDKRVEKYMPKVKAAVERHLPPHSPEAVDVYNRAYEAVYAAIIDSANWGCHEPKGRVEK